MKKYMDAVDICKVKNRDAIAVIKDGLIVREIPFNGIRINKDFSYEFELTASKLWGVLGRMPTRFEEQLLKKALSTALCHVEERGTDPTTGER